MNNQDIDIVIIWVDGSDTNWIKQFNQFAPKENQKNIDIRASRYNEYGLLKYWFRSIEKNAPWARKIHFVTNGQKPEWLNEHASKLNWVKHSDYMDSNYLPTFSSHPIELNLHKINDLAENFVYFNDDMFLLNAVPKEYFFKKNVPVMNARATLRWLQYPELFSKIVYNDVKLINNCFSFNSVVKKNKAKWLLMNPIKSNISNFIFSLQKYVPGFSTQHQANSYTKTTFNEVWNEYYDYLNKTSNNKFRTSEDVNQFIFYYWQLCKGNFYPRQKNTSEYYVVSESNFGKIQKCFENNKTKLFCLNDNDDEDCTEIYNQIIKLFESKFPDKSSFEL